MQSENLLNINLAHVAEAAKRLSIELTDSFFADLEQDEISGGDVHANILVTASAGDIFNIKIDLCGTVVVPCDRCLDPLVLDVNVSDTIKVKDADPEESDIVDLQYLEKGNPCYDLSWNIYEIIETALPMQRVHPDGECNQEMVSYIIRENDDEDEDDEYFD